MRKKFYTYCRPGPGIYNCIHCQMIKESSGVQQPDEQKKRPGYLWNYFYAVPDEFTLTF